MLKPREACGKGESPFQRTRATRWLVKQEEELRLVKLFLKKDYNAFKKST